MPLYQTPLPVSRIFSTYDALVGYFLLLLISVPITSHALLIEQLPNYKIVDNDLLSRDNLALVNRYQVDYQYQAVTSHGKQYRLGQFSKSTVNLTNQPTLTPVLTKFLVLHDSEDAAFDSGLQTIAQSGGTLWVLENKENRNLYDFASDQLTHSDPNRMFWQLSDPLLTSKPVSDKSMPSKAQAIQIAADVADNNNDEVNDNAEFANYLLEQLGVNQTFNHLGNDKLDNKLGANKQPILVALHNNRAKGNFGVNYIDEFGNTQVACQHDQEPKNLIWLASAESQILDKKHQKNQKLIDKLCQTNRVNVVIETAPTVADGDGSLSIYMTNRYPQWQYVNIEIKAGKKGDPVDETRAKTDQLRYINVLKSVLTK